MIKFIMPLLIVLSTHAGVGGIAGGTEKFQVGNSIHFQEQSAWVNVLYSKSLCQNDYDYEAVIKTCARWEKSGNDSQKCVDWRNVNAVQPKESTRYRCKRFEDDDCVEWIEVDYIQSPNRIYEVRDDDGDVKKRLKLVVPTCKK